MAYFALTLTLAAYILWFLFWNNYRLSNDTAAWASFGDFFGGTVGPFVGFASIILLVETLKLQRRGLEEQQTRIMLKQAFEQSFFGWLRDYKQLISGFRFSKKTLKNTSSSPEKTVFTGLDAISKMVDLFQLASLPDLDSKSDLKKKKQNIKNKLIMSWSQMYEHQGEIMRTSLRTLFGLLRWIDDHESLQPAEKRHYASILRAQLSDHELILIYINGLTTKGEKMNYYINRYALFDDLELTFYPALLEIYDEENPEPYSPSAFKIEEAIKMHWQNEICN